MKIQCEQCKIEYNIDDASIGERGIRAQCPRCNHITTIRKSQSAIMDQARARLDMAICVNCGKPTEPNPNDPIPICPSCQALSSSTGELGAKTTVGGMPPLGRPNAGPPPPPSGGAVAGAAPMPQIGAPPVYTPGSDAGMQWKIKKAPGGDIYGPFDRDLITGWIETDKIVPGDEIQRVGGPWTPASSHPDFIPVFQKRYKDLPSGDAGLETARDTARPAAPPPAARPMTMRGPTPGAKPRQPMPWGVIFAIGVAVLMVGVVAALFVQGVIAVPSFERATPVPIADSLDKRLDAIKDEFPNVTGTTQEHLAAGKTAMASDNVEGWTTARGEFLQALALDRANYEAMAGLAEVNAFLARYDQQSSLLDDAYRLAGRATERAPDLVDGHRAKAAAMLATPNPKNAADARALLEASVLPKLPDDPSVTTLLGVAWRGADEAKAEDVLKKTMAAAPNLIRPRLELGILYAETKRYQKALETFKPIAGKSFLASFRSGEINAQVGNYKEAAQAYKAAAKAAQAGGGRPFVEATIAAAVIQYQALKDTRGANALLAPLEAEFLAQNKLRSDQANRLRLHLAIIARLQGQLDRSLELSQKVIADNELEFASAANFNVGLTKFRKADFDGADRAFEEADAAGIDKQVRSEIYFWQAQLRARRGDTGGAGQKYDDAIRDDPHNWKAIVGYAILKGDALGQMIAALDQMQELAKYDPEFYENYQKVTPWFPDPTADLLDKANAVFSKIFAAEGADPRSASALGMLAFFQGRRPLAEKFFQQALGETNPDTASYVFSGILAEARGDRANLTRALDRYNTVRTQARSPFLSTAIGRVEAKLGQNDKAIGDIQEALSQDPNYVPAHYWLGEAYQRRGDSRMAIEKWSAALKNDPGYLKASRALLENG